MLFLQKDGLIFLSMEALEPFMEISVLGLIWFLVIWLIKEKSLINNRYFSLFYLHHYQLSGRMRFLLLNLSVMEFNRKDEVKDK